MNPIEHIWDELGQRATTNHQINNVQDLTRVLQLEWQAFPNVFIRRYVNSMSGESVHVLLAMAATDATDELLPGKA